jgi:[ribosomal protein S5]-alanine N-acetyltransferase
MSRVPIVQTPRLVLTHWEPSDVDDLLAVHSDTATMRFVRHGRPETRQETATLIEDYIAEDLSAGYTKWRLTDSEDQLVGRAGFGAYRDGRELGYTIRRDMWARGLATEIATALVAWHLKHAAAVPLYGCVATDNPASRRVLQKIGFHFVEMEDRTETQCEVLRWKPF